MKEQEYKVLRYDADEGMVFDWANPDEHISVDEDGKEIVDHLYVKTLFLSVGDSIDNYIEVEE